MEINIVATDGEVQVKDVVFPDKERITDDKWSKSTDSICISGNTIKQYGKDGKTGVEVYFDGLVLDCSNSGALVCLVLGHWYVKHTYGQFLYKDSVFFLSSLGILSLTNFVSL